jgi:hypothetical protein
VKFSITEAQAKGKKVPEHCAARGIPCIESDDGFIVHCGDEKIFAEILGGKMDEDTFIESEKRTAEKKAAKAAAIEKSEIERKARLHVVNAIAEAEKKAKAEAAEMLKPKAKPEKKTKK